MASSIGQQILNGADPASFKLVEESLNRYIFDYDVMIKYELDVDLLPEESLILHKPLTLSESNPNLYWMIVIGFVSLSLIIIILVVILYYRVVTAKRALKDHKSLDGIIKGADDALYKAKSVGRNQVQSAI